MWHVYVTRLNDFSQNVSRARVKKKHEFLSRSKRSKKKNEIENEKLENENLIELFRDVRLKNVIINNVFLVSRIVRVLSFSKNIDKYIFNDDVDDNQFTFFLYNSISKYLSNDFDFDINDTYSQNDYNIVDYQIKL